MSHHDAIIRIKNLRLRTFIGIKEEEINNRQDIVINVAIHYPNTTGSLMLKWKSTNYTRCVMPIPSP